MGEGEISSITNCLPPAVVAVRLIVLATNISLLSKILSKRLQESLAFKLAEGILSNNFTQSDKV